MKIDGCDEVVSFIYLYCLVSVLGMVIWVLSLVGMVVVVVMVVNRVEMKMEICIMVCDGVFGKIGCVSLFEEIEVEGLCGRSFVY